MLRLTVLFCVLGLACGDDDSSPGTDGGADVGTMDARGDDGGDDAGGDDGGGDDAGGVDGGGDDAGGDAGEPTACGARLGDTCEDNEYCDFPDNLCGAADGTGVCRARPEDCPDIFMPVCACSGEVQSSACDANSAGFDVNSLGCTPPENMFACGYLFCSTTQYCRIIIDDTGLPPAYECAEFPDPCDGGGMDCTCVAGEACGDVCGTDDDGNVTVTCPGG